MRLAQAFLDIPEYHDEGRLPAGVDAHGDSVLGPLAGIYASPFLHGFTRPAQIYEQGERGTLAGLVVVEQQYGEAMPETYKALGLEFGLNCVWLYVDPPDDGVSRRNVSAYNGYLRHLKYRAWVSKAIGDPPQCDRNATMSAELPVVAVRSAVSLTDSVYLPVARFDTDMEGHLILGLRCLAAFCEIGVSAPDQVRNPMGTRRVLNNPNIPANDNFVVVPANGQDIDKRMAIKAWHDQQTLAVRDRYNYWRPSGVRAKITPDVRAATLDSVDFVNTWKRVATLHIAGAIPDSSKYTKWGLVAGENYVEFQDSVSSDTHKWRARIVNASGTKEWGVMQRTLHRDVSVPPIVRFRWASADDGVWAPCGNACCRASDDT